MRSSRAVSRRGDTQERLLAAAETTVAHLRLQLAAIERHRAAHPKADGDPSFAFAEAALLRALASAIDQTRFVRDA